MPKIFQMQADSPPWDYKWEDGDQILVLLNDSESGIQWFEALYFCEREGGFISLMRDESQRRKFEENEFQELIGWSILPDAADRSAIFANSMFLKKI